MIASVLFLTLFLVSNSHALGDGNGADPAAVTQLAPQVEAAPPAIDSGDTAWILTSTALVLFMTIPGLALFYGGLVHSQNVLSVLMHCLVITAIVSIIWVLFGYSIALDDSINPAAGEIGLGSFIGGFNKLGLNNVMGNVTGTIPELLVAAFQMTFAVITPALIVGAFAERMKFSAVLLFSILWLIVVYLPICHMTWGGGLFATWGVLDLAGGIVVHVTAGVAALVACIMVGPRKGFPKDIRPPHSTVLTLVGTGMLWVGWFGFNGGSHLTASESAVLTLLVTHLSASAATLVWMAIEWIKFGRPSVLGAATGSIAGLAAITPASGSVGPMGALVIGAASAILCFYFATVLKQKLGYDDSLDVFGVHGVGGFLGTVLCGVFVAKSMGGNGLAEGMTIGSQVGVQFGAAALTAVYTVIATVVILLVVKALVGLRVDDDTETRGLDLSEHGERGYIL
jgi:Amt family ammonium transporter